MNRIISFASIIGLAIVMSACKPAAAPAPAEPEAAPAAEVQKQPAAEKPAENAHAAAEADKTADKADKDEKTDDEAPADPDDEGTWGSDNADKIDRDKLSKTYTEVYCAQKKGEMDKLLDIYKKHGFEKPEDFISTWIEAARDTAWVTRVATDAAAKCK